MKKFSPLKKGQHAKYWQLASTLVVSAVLVSCSSMQQVPSNYEGYRDPSSASDGRGSPAEYDAGPDKNSQWPDLFAATPNYRAYGKAVYAKAAQLTNSKPDTTEKFRWVVGPMWYRGRLTPNSVKVFIIGQEGAQDENISNRTFTGSTGTKMQSFINYFGITKSYLFMNTFSYTINGQYGDPGLHWLAQDPQSVVVKHRHSEFDYMLSQNKNTLRLIIGVGAAGKETLATWIQSHGGNCTAAMLSKSFCNADVIAPGVIAIGTMHPGAGSAANGGAQAEAALHAQFAAKAAMIAKKMQAEQNWLVPDVTPDFSKPYVFRNAAIPYRDFAFGSNWRLGKDGTSSNRIGPDGIQIFSDHGTYGDRTVQFDDPKDMQTAAQIGMAAGDVPYESPKSQDGRRQYDQGPGNFAPVLMTGWPNFMALGVTEDTSLGYSGLYRGNLSNPEVLVVGDQESHDDMFSTRAMTGAGGQRLQTFFNAIGAKNYAIIRTLPVDTMDLPADKAQQIAMDPSVQAVRKNILDSILKQGKTKVILAVGPAAQAVMANYPAGVKVVNMADSNDPNHVSNWQAAAQQLAGMGIGLTAGNYDGHLTAIPRGDLPVHTRWWMGTSGSRGVRGYRGKGAAKQWSGDFYGFEAPTWVNPKNYPANPSELSSGDMASLQNMQLTTTTVNEQ